ncbi:NnrS family protein [Shewanella waksmanii]|uniref:NnrS family protein n=1 Tax=Shewanella waksmanii TaxID=213783 RepID=UPI003736E898
MAKQPTYKINLKLNSDGELIETQSPQSTYSAIAEQPIWELAFRPWFLAASLLSCISLLIWSLALNGHVQLLSYTSLSPVTWHIHEMLFGFGATIAVAFLLTAAQTWTGKPSIHGWPLIGLTCLWLIARAAIWLANDGWQWLILFSQTAWWLACIGYLANMVISSKSRRNYQFIPLLLAMMTLNVGILLADYSGNLELARHLSRCAILLFSLLVGIVGGRVIPFFTSRGAQNAKVTPTPLLDKLVLLTAVTGTSIFLLSGLIDLPMTPATLLITTGILHLLRQWHWAPFATARVPLLWSLHAAYFALGFGLICLGGSYYVNWLSFADALHIITVGTLGAMILAMIARVSLGHTGRSLVVHWHMTAAFYLILLGCVLRIALPTIGQPVWGWNLSAGTWIAAFSLFIWHYWPILIAPRVSK